MQSAICKNDLWFARYRHNSVRLYNIYNKDTLKAEIDIINSITAGQIVYVQTFYYDVIVLCIDMMCLVSHWSIICIPLIMARPASQISANIHDFDEYIEINT